MKQNITLENTMEQNCINLLQNSLTEKVRVNYNKENYA